MADIAFHRKYRPLTINEYIGDSMRSILLNRFSDEDKLPQTILLYGMRGCGKTSAARLIAKEYLCLNKVDGHACGQCEMCREVEDKLIKGEAGVEAFGVQELDIASESGKAAIDSVLEEALIEPLPPLKYKILILDECHMATKQAQNRLLKIVEEPPKHLVFIFCTTDPEQLLDTLKSRCQLKIEVKKPSVEDLAQRLLQVCQSEGITTSLAALRIIAKKADRIPREALNILESIAKEFNGVVTIENVRKRTGEIASEIYTEYYSAANKSLEDIILFVKKLKDSNVALKDFIRGLTRFTLDSIYIRYGINIDEYPADYVKAVKEVFKVYKTDDLDFILQIIEHANKLISSDETKSELVVITTAMRLGKVKMLEGGLIDALEAAEKENRKSLERYRNIVNQERLESRRTIKKEVDSALLLSVFGEQVIEVKPDKEIEILKKNESKPEVEDADMLSDEELLAKFNIGKL